MKFPKIDISKVIEDFRSLNPNDVGAWPLLPRAIALGGLFVGVLIAGWFLFWSAELEDLSQKEGEEIKLKEEYLDKKKQAINLDLYKNQLAEIDRSFGVLLKQLPNKSEVEALLVEVNQSGLGRGLQFDLFKPAPEQMKDFYAELPISVRITGGFHDFGAFAADIARLPRIVTLNNISISAGKEGALSMDAITKTFRYLDEDELARLKKERAAQDAKAKGGKK